MMQPASPNDLLGIPDLFKAHIKGEFYLLSRIASSSAYFENASKNIFIKREDELSSGISGSKYRKFASLLQHLLREEYDEVVVIGSAQSNNVMGLLQLLNEHSIRSNLFLLENKSALKGNILFTNLLHDGKNIRWISRGEWPGVNELAHDYAHWSKNEGKRIFIVREGAANFESLPGAVTLAYDIARNEAEKGIRFQHIFIDSGTGSTAIGMLIGLTLLDRSDINVHVTLIAGAETEFMLSYNDFLKHFNRLFGLDLPLFKHIHFHRSVSAMSFGSMNAEVLNEVGIIARSEGILMEPVYSVKHFMAAKKFILENKPAGNNLVIYNGGSLGLAGFHN